MWRTKYEAFASRDHSGGTFSIFISWFNGDFDYDNTVNTVDFNLLASNFAQALAAPTAGAQPLGLLVPEPSMIGLIALGGLLARRRRI